MRYRIGTAASTLTAGGNMANKGPKTRRPCVDLGPMGGTQEEVYDKAITLVATFAKLCNIDELEIRQDLYGYTDCESFVAANFGDPEAYLTIEHELSHCFFDTDLQLAQTFRDIAVGDLCKRAGYSSTHPDIAPYKNKVESLIHCLWNCLEDHRVRTLWEQLYPGGGALLEERWNNIAKYDLEENAKIDLISYLLRAATGVDTPAAPMEFKMCKPHLERALRMVGGRDKKTCIAATKALVDDIADELVKQAKAKAEMEQNNQGQGQQTVKIGNMIVSSRPPQGNEDSGKVGAERGKNAAQKDQMDKLLAIHRSVKPSNSSDPINNPMGGKDLEQGPSPKKVRAADISHIKQILKMAAKARKGDASAIDKLDQLKEKGMREMEAKLEKARAELAAAFSNEKDPAEAAKVEYTSAAKAAQMPFSIVENPAKLPKPSPHASRLQQHFQRIRMQKKSRLLEEGDDIDIGAFLEAKLNGDDLCEAKIFRKDTKESGLELLLLVDASGSMWGFGQQIVDQALADIQKAVNGLKVQLHVWAFSNTLYFLPKVGSIAYIGGGGTDLLPALDCAVEWALQSKSSRGIIMITDGYPTSCRNRDSTGNPQQDMANVLHTARHDGIVVSTLAVGDDPNYDTWFGKGQYGKVNTLQDLQEQLMECAKVLVENHLKKHS